MAGKEKKMTNSNLYDAWETIVLKAKNECNSNNQNIYVPYGSCQFGMTYISTNRIKNKSLYIEVLPEAADKIQMPKIQGLSFEYLSVPAIDISKMYLRISLVNTDALEEAFEAFTVSVINSIQSLTSSVDVLVTISQLVFDYESFFGSEKTKHLSKQEEQGLFGELHFLSKLIEEKSEDSVQWWMGPSKNKHDFIFESNVGVEIKTTSSQLQKNISISNENQLRFEDRKKLFLILYVLEVNPTGRTVSNLIKEVEEKIERPANRKEFKERLLEFGILPSNFIGRYSFVNVGSYIFEINSLFPRISKQMVDSRIFDVKYKINVDQMPQYNGNMYEEL